MYTNEDINIILNKINENENGFGDTFIKVLNNYGLSGVDRCAIKNVIAENYYEGFDRYDSAVCEYFLNIYEKTVDTLLKM